MMKIRIIIEKLFILVLAGFVVHAGTQEVKAAAARMYFSPGLTNAQTQQEVTADIMIDTGGEEAGGAGAKLIFDPQRVIIKNITPGTIFADYPVASFDNQNGKAALSGIVSSPDDLYTGVDSLGKVTFIPLQPGDTNIRFEFVPGKTDDSNIAVTSGSGDTLDAVGNLTIRVSGNAVAKEAVLQAATAEQTETRPTSVPLDETGPIPSQEPITDPDSQQEEIPASIIQTQAEPDSTVAPSQQTAWTTYAIIGGIIVTVIIAITVLMKKMRGNGRPPQVGV